MTDTLSVPSVPSDSAAPRDRVLPAIRRRRRARFVALLIMLVGAGVLLYPVLATSYNNYKQAQFADQYATQVNALPAEARQQALQSAADYNATIQGIPILDPWLTQVQTQVDTGEYKQYLDQLAGLDVMARLRVPSIDANLPIYHGTTEETLSRGVGHLYGTSLPVGGAGTHAVLTAHTGLATATLFDHLNKVRVGDTFYIDVLGQTLAYRVYDIEVVTPDQIETLGRKDGEDLVTLVTCTPYAVNSHRLLVHAERVPYEAAATPDAPRVDTSMLEPWMYWLIAGSAATVLLIIVLSRRSRRQRQRSRRHAA